MEDRYTEEQLAIIDSIILRLKDKGFITPNELVASENFAYEILDSNGWIKAHRSENRSIFYIQNSKLFDSKIAGGTFGERYKRLVASSEQQSEKVIVTGDISANNSYVAIGTNIKQSRDLSLYDKAIDQIDQINDERLFTEDEKKCVIDLLSDLKELQQSHSMPGRTLMKTIAIWSEKLISLGGAVATIIQSFA